MRAACGPSTSDPRAALALAALQRRGLGSRRGVAGGAVSGRRGSERVVIVIASGLVSAAVEVILAISFASLVFGCYLIQTLASAIGLYLLAGAAALARVPWRAATPGLLGRIPDAPAAVPA